MTKELLRDIMQWDVTTWSEALNYWEKSVDWSKVQNGLELGGRQGGLTLWLALKGKIMVCSDLEQVKTTAEPLHQKYNVNHLIHYQDIDATAIPYENHFDLIVFKSIVGGVGRKDNCNAQQQLFDQTYKALKPGGILLFAENLVASPFHQRLRKLFTSWEYYWRYVSVKDLKNYLQCFSSVELHTTGFLATFGRSEPQKNLLTKLDRVLFNHLSPISWKYMAYGMAVK